MVRALRSIALVATVVLMAAFGLPTGSANAATGAASVSYVQGAAAVLGARAGTQALSFTHPVAAGDLLVGWFAQYDANGPVTVSDNVNGAWTRGVSETFSSGSGDIALYFKVNSAAASGGLTVTVSATAPTYLQSSAAEYAGVAPTNPLDQAAANRGVGTAVDTGPTAAVPGGELVFSALTTGGAPGTVVPGSSQSASYIARASTSSGTAYEQDITAGAPGAQRGAATLGAATDWYALVATFTVAGGSAGGGSAAPTFQQGAAFSSGARSTQATLSLSRPVHAGDLLVGYFAQFAVPGAVTVSDNVNGAWTRAPASLTFQNDSGDIAAYYLANARPSASGVTVTVSAPTAAYLQGTAAEYSGMAVAGPLDQVTAARGVGTAVTTGPSGAIAAGELVYSAVLTGSAPNGVSPGSSRGVPFVPRASTGSGSAYEQDITAAAAGAQTGTAQLGTSADWYSIVAGFRVFPTGDTSPPTSPTALACLSAASSRVALTWSPATGDVTAYTVYRNGTPVGTAPVGTTTYLDTTVAGGTTYSYAVDAVDGAGLHSTRSAAIEVVTPVSSPSFVQGTAASPGSRQASLTLTFPGPVAAGDLLVGWFGQYNAPGSVQVSDNVNGPWTRGSSETFTSGTGDIALEYVAGSRPAPGGVTITVTASAPAYLQEAVADFRGVATTTPLVTSIVGHANANNVSLGPTAAVPSGDLLVMSTLTAGQPGTIGPGSSRGVPAVLDVMNGSGSSSLQDVLSTAAGAQSGAETLGSASTSYSVLAVFRGA